MSKGEIILELNSLLDYASLFFLQYVPNGLTYILAGYALAGKTINRREYLSSSMILAVAGFTAKIFSQVKLEGTGNSLPQILIIFACIFLLIYRNKISPMYAILSSLIAMLLQLIFEVIYMVLFLQKMLNVDMNLIFNQPNIVFSLIGFPYLLAFGLLVILIYKRRIKRRV